MTDKRSWWSEVFKWDDQRVLKLASGSIVVDDENAIGSGRTAAV
jgi:hypothetical protein